MKSLIVKLLLLLSLSFNISHAAFITAEDDHNQCHHDTVAAFVLEQFADADNCGDLCEIHHFFHFMAIIETPVVAFDTHIMTETPSVSKTLYDTSIPQTDIKPPIA